MKLLEQLSKNYIFNELRFKFEPGFSTPKISDNINVYGKYYHAIYDPVGKQPGIRGQNIHLYVRARYNYNQKSYDTLRANLNGFPVSIIGKIMSSEVIDDNQKPAIYCEIDLRKFVYSSDLFYQEKVFKGERDDSIRNVTHIVGDVDKDGLYEYEAFIIFEDGAVDSYYKKFLLSTFQNSIN